MQPIRTRTARKIFRASLASSIISWLALCAIHHGLNFQLPQPLPPIDNLLFTLFLTTLSLAIIIDHYHLQAPRARAKRIRALRKAACSTGILPVSATQ